MAEVTVGSVAAGWEARVGSEPIGRLEHWVRADQRCQMRFKDCRADAYGPLLAQAAAELERDLFLNADEAHRDRLTAFGFVVQRRQLLYRIPTDPARLRVAALGPPDGVDLVSAADADLDQLRVLDDAVRQDIPGTDGWRWGPEEFREETFSDGFDPATYLVAVERRTDRYVGLVRIWLKADGPRLGCLGVLPRFRRTRVVPALLGAAVGAVRDRGYASLSTDIAETNRAANALAARCGAVLVGHFYELVLRRRSGR